MKTASRPSFVALLCLGVSGCAILPLAAMNLAAQGAQGLVALTLGPLSAMQEAADGDRCSRSTGKGISVSESLETAIPTNEGTVNKFEPASWRPEFAQDGYPQSERSRTPTEGALAIGERSLLLVPPPGATMVRIPYELVQGIEVRRDSVNGEARSMIVKSCYGRFDIVSFWQRWPTEPDPDATLAAAAQLEARVAAFRTAAGE